MMLDLSIFPPNFFFGSFCLSVLALLVLSLCRHPFFRPRPRFVCSDGPLGMISIWNPKWSKGHDQPAVPRLLSCAHVMLYVCVYSGTTLLH